MSEPSERWYYLNAIQRSQVMLVREALADTIQSAQTPLSGAEPPWMKKDVEQSRRITEAVNGIESTLASLQQEVERLRRGLEAVISHGREWDRSHLHPHDCYEDIAAQALSPEETA